jgi:excisionase family DNA binding protein
MKPRKRTARTRIKVYWENPPGPGQGLWVERLVRGHVYKREVGPHGVLSPPEVASALDVTREFVYRLIWSKKLRAVKRRGLLVVPVSSVKEYDARRVERRQRLKKRGG